jgi:hypothetical protein
LSENNLEPATKNNKNITKPHTQTLIYSSHSKSCAILKIDEHVLHGLRQVRALNAPDVVHEVRDTLLTRAVFVARLGKARQADEVVTAHHKAATHFLVC